MSSSYDYSQWLRTPAGRFYAASHGGHAAALASYQAESAAELERLREIQRDHDNVYPEPAPPPDADPEKFDAAMAARRRAQTEQLRLNPAVRPQTGTAIAGSAESIAKALRREDPMYVVGVSPEGPDTNLVRIAEEKDISRNRDGSLRIDWQAPYA